MFEKKISISDNSIINVLLNDLKHGRTNASLMSVAHLFNFKLHFAYPNRFGPDESVLENLKRKGVETNDHKNNL